MPTFYEFFAGGGMARLGLGAGWRCLLANDNDPKKTAAYKAYWGEENLIERGVEELTAKDISGHADLSWASFPCQDLSLAGYGAGLNGERSGTFWYFWDLMRALAKDIRPPKLIVLENVQGALTSHGGEDFAAIARALFSENYRFGAMVIDAVHFVPQSRPRLFILGVHESIEVPKELTRVDADRTWHPPSIEKAHSKLPRKIRVNWLWWHMPKPPQRQNEFSDLIEENPKGVHWNSDEYTQKLLDMMSDVNLKKVKSAQSTGQRMVGGVYRRMRNGAQRAEVRFDGISGCLRTPVGGSSRQTTLIVEGEKIRSRLLSPREAARLMGLPDKYPLPEKYNEAYHLMGDGLVVPVVTHLAGHILEPCLDAKKLKKHRAD